jgi:vancomycin permeability regulator SanA
MKSIEKMIEKYQKKLLRDDEDVDAVAYGVVNSFTREQCLGLLNELTDEELHQIVALFVMDKVKALLISADEDFERDGSGFLH